MPDILRLRQFDLLQLHVDWAPPKDGADADLDEPIVGCHYEVLRSKESPREFALEFTVKVLPAPGKPVAGYVIDAKIVGFFSFPESMDEEQMQQLIRINGGTILYGILRGQLSAFTGAFPGGQFILPAVYMQEVVVDVERKRMAEAARAAKKRTPKDTPKKAAAGRKKKQP